MLMLTDVYVMDEYDLDTQFSGFYQACTTMFVYLQSGANLAPQLLASRLLLPLPDSHLPASMGCECMDTVAGDNYISASGSAYDRSIPGYTVLTTCLITVDWLLSALSIHICMLQGFGTHMRLSGQV